MNLFSRKNKEKRSSILFSKKSSNKHQESVPSQFNVVNTYNTNSYTANNYHHSSSNVNHHTGRPTLSTLTESHNSRYSNAFASYSSPFETYSPNSPDDLNHQSFPVSPISPNMSSAPRKKPPPKSPSDYETAQFASINSSLNLDDRKDTIQRRASLRKADTSKKTLPKIPPSVTETPKKYHEQSFYPPNLTTIPLKSPAPPPIPSSSPTIHDVLSDSEYAPSAYSLRSTASSQTSGTRGQNFNPNVSRLNGTPRNFNHEMINLENSRSYSFEKSPPMDKPRSASQPVVLSPGFDNEGIPKRNERRRSQAAFPVSQPPQKSSLTSGLTVNNPNRIPPRSAGRNSIYLPFTSNDEPVDPVMPKANANVRSKRVSTAITESNPKDGSVSKLNEIYASAPVLEVATTSPPPRIRTSFQPYPDMSEDNSETSSPFSPGSSYLIDGGVLDFGDSFDANKLFKEMQDEEDSVTSSPASRKNNGRNVGFIPADIGKKKELKSKLELQIGHQLQELMVNLQRSNFLKEMKTVEQDVLAIEQSYHKLKRTRTLKHQQKRKLDSSIGEFSELDTDLQKFMYLQEYVKSKKAQFETAMKLSGFEYTSSPISDLSKTPPELKNRSFDLMVGSPSDIPSPSKPSMRGIDESLGPYMSTANSDSQTTLEASIKPLIANDSPFVSPFGDVDSPDLSVRSNRKSMNLGIIEESPDLAEKADKTKAISNASPFESLDASDSSSYGSSSFEKTEVNSEINASAKQTTDEIKAEEATEAKLDDLEYDYTQIDKIVTPSSPLDEVSDEVSDEEKEEELLLGQKVLDKRPIVPSNAASREFLVEVNNKLDSNDQGTETDVESEMNDQFEVGIIPRTKREPSLKRLSIYSSIATSKRNSDDTEEDDDEYFNRRDSMQSYSNSKIIISRTDSVSTRLDPTNSRSNSLSYRNIMKSTSNGNKYAKSRNSNKSSDRYNSIRTEYSKFSVASPADTQSGTIDDGRISQDFDSDGTVNSSNYSSASLKDFHLKRCREVWSLSGIYNWLCMFNVWFQGQIIRESQLRQSLEVLVKFFYPRLKEDSSAIANLIMEELYGNFKCITGKLDKLGNPESGKIIKIISKELLDEEQKPSGVVTPLLKCYSTKYLHEDLPIEAKKVFNYCCYSFSCPHETKRGLNLDVPAISNPNELRGDWIQYWGLTETELASLDKRVIVLQSRIYDLVRKQYDFLQSADYLVNTIGEKFLQNENMDMFVYPDSKYTIHSKLFGSVKPLMEGHKQYLLDPMMKIMKEQGKFIKHGIFALYKTWTKNCFKKYVEYLDNFSDWYFFLKFERNFKKDSPFMKWVEKFPNDRVEVERYFLSNQIFYNIVNVKDSLIDIKKSLLKTDPEMKYLEESIFIVSTFCDRMDSRTGAADVHTVFKNLIWKISPDNFNILFNPNDVHLVFEEEVIRKSSPYVGIRSSSQYYLILFNNSLFLTELDTDNKKYKVVEKPIPIELVAWEIPKASDLEEEGVIAQNVPDDRKFNSLLKIVHSGQKTSWTLKFLKKNSRLLWIEYLKKTKKERALKKPLNITFNAVVTDMMVSDHSVINPLEQESLSRYFVATQPSTSAIVGACNNYIKYAFCPHGVKKILCSLYVPYKGESYYLIGTPNDLYVRNNSNGWEKLGKFPNVTQLEHISEADLILILADRKFQQLSLDDIVRAYKTNATSIPSVKLSHQSVQFFGVGFIKNARILFYMKVKVSTSVTPNRTFKMLILDVSKRAFKTSSMFDKFFSAIDCYDCSTFQDSVILKTEKGFQMLDSELVPVLIPRSLSIKLPSNMKTKEADFFKMVEHRVTTEKPIGSYEIRNGTEVLLVFSTFAVFCNERGFLSQKDVLEFNIKCYGASLVKGKLYAVGKSAIEVYDLNANEKGINPCGVVTGEEFELLNKESINNGRLMVMVNKPNDSSKLLLELVSCR